MCRRGGSDDFYFEAHKLLRKQLFQACQLAVDRYNFRSEVASAPGPISSFGLAPSAYSGHPGRLTRRGLTRLAG